MDPYEAAVSARTALACASVAALTTYPRNAPARTHLTNVAVRAQADGSAVVLLRPDCLAVQQLLARPFGTVHVAPRGCERVTLHGGAQRLSGTDHLGRLRFRIEAGAVRLGDRGQTIVEAAAYASAVPDPVGRDASAVLAHLRRPHHAEQLAACLRAAGHDACFAEAVRLDRHGLTALAVGLDGVSEVHLAFPGPVTRLEELPPGLRLVLMCRCAGPHCAAPGSTRPPLAEET